MKRLVVVRHGESIGNREGIIQGPNNDYKLSENGKENIKKLVEGNIALFEGAQHIFSSPLIRAAQTANIIQQKLPVSLNITYDPNLTEFDSGILGGKTHEFCEKFFPQYFDIWIARKDLDGIPYAEKGDELQARAIAFLLQYVDKESFNDIVVSHAGFIRCLVNTALNKPRVTPISIHNGAIHVIDDPLGGLAITRKNRAMSSKVFIVKSADKTYVVKKKDRPISVGDIEEKRIINILSNKIPNLPLILGNFNSYDSKSSTKVMRFIEGQHCYGRLPREKEIALLKQFLTVNNELSCISSDSFQEVDLISELRHTCKTPYARKIVQSLLTDYTNLAKLKNSQYVLCHNDLNRDNILFNDKNEVSFIDWEGVELCPKSYAKATFLTSTFLLEGYSVEETIKFAKILDNNIDENFLLFLMQIRLFKGIFFFTEQQNSYTQENILVSNEIIFKYKKANDELTRYKHEKVQNYFGDRIKGGGEDR